MVDAQTQVMTQGRLGNAVAVSASAWASASADAEIGMRGVSLGGSAQAGISGAIEARIPGGDADQDIAKSTLRAAVAARVSAQLMARLDRQGFAARASLSAALMAELEAALQLPGTVLFDAVDGLPVVLRRPTRVALQMCNIGGAFVYAAGLAVEATAGVLVTGSPIPSGPDQRSAGFTLSAEYRAGFIFGAGGRLRWRVDLPDADDVLTVVSRELVGSLADEDGLDPQLRTALLGLMPTGWSTTLEP